MDIHYVLDEHEVVYVGSSVLLDCLLEGAEEKKETLKVGYEQENDKTRTDQSTYEATYTHIAFIERSNNYLLRYIQLC